MQESNGKEQTGNIKLKEKAEAIQELTKLNWGYYWTYAVNPHSQNMTLKYIINLAEKMVLALTISIGLAVMKPAQEKIEKIDQRLRIQPLRGGNLLYIT